MSTPQEPYQPALTGLGSRQLPQQPHFGPDQDAAPFGLPGKPPPRSRRELRTILAGVGGVLLLVVLGIIILVNMAGSATNQARGLADGFTRLVLAGEGSRAYDEYLDPALKKQLSKEAFISGVGSLEMDKDCKPDYRDVKAGTEDGITSADIAGLITCEGKKVDLAYRFEGAEELKMTNIKLRPAG